MLEIGTMTNAECLVISRHRLKENQIQAAERHEVSLDMYSRWERGLDPRSPRPFLIAGELKEHETCFLTRRRAGITQKHVAVEMNYCRWWVNRMERGDAPCHDLTAYWRKRK